MFAVACSKLFRPSLPVIGGRAVVHNFDKMGNHTTVTWNACAGPRGTWRHCQWRVPGNAAATSRPGSVDATYMGVLSAVIAAATSVEIS
jgi:hypothetical protein